MALPALISRLEDEADHRARDIERDAEAEVRAIDMAADQAVRDATASHLQHEHARRQAEYGRTQAAARQRARARELEARRSQIARILERARSLVDEAAELLAYGQALPSHLDEALSYLEGLRPRVRCKAAIAPLLQATIARHEDVELRIDDSVGPGVIAEAADRSVVVDNTLAARLARAEHSLTIELSRMLGGPHD